MFISVSELKDRLDKGENVLLLDIREADEYNICHLENALLIPLRQLPQQVDELDQKQSIVCYCHYGIRSAQAARWLLSNGFKDVKSLNGGIDEWAETIEPEMDRY